MPVPGRASGVKIYAKSILRIMEQVFIQYTIPDQSGLGLLTTATGTVSQQGISGNYATVGQRRRRRRGVKCVQKRHRNSRSVGVRWGTLNVGSMTGRGRRKRSGGE